MKQDLQLNRITNVTVIEAAVSNRCGAVPFDEGPSSPMGHISSHGGLHVKTVGLDELISRGQIPVPDYIRIDVEGAEMLVLSGAKQCL